MSEGLRVLVCGGRDYDNHVFLDMYMDKLDGERGINTIIEGTANGADFLACRWANARGKTKISFPADWDCYPRSAGMIRNSVMLKEGKPDLVVAFPGGRGTANMIEISKRAGLEVHEL